MVIGIQFTVRLSAFITNSLSYAGCRAAVAGLALYCLFTVITKVIIVVITISMRTHGSFAALIVAFVVLVTVHTSAGRFTALVALVVVVSVCAGLAYVALAVITNVVFIGRRVRVRILARVKCGTCRIVVTYMIFFRIYACQRPHTCFTLITIVIAITTAIRAFSDILGICAACVITPMVSIIILIGVLGSSICLFNIAFFAPLPMVFAIRRPFKRGTCMLLTNDLSAHVTQRVFIVSVGAFAPFFAAITTEMRTLCSLTRTA